MMSNRFDERRPPEIVTPTSEVTPLQSNLLAQAASLRAQADTLELLARSIAVPSTPPAPAVGVSSVKAITVREIHLEYNLATPLIHELFRNGSLPNLGSRTQFKTSRLAVEEYLVRRSTGRA